MVAPFAERQNMILVMQNAILPDGPAQRRLAKREADYTSEIRRLLDAGLEVMRRCGTASRPRVADIVAAAGLSNDAFYRHFPSKEVLVAAIIDDGSARLASYLTHHMAKAKTPRDQVRAWVDGVMAQAADDEVAASTLAVMWNGATVGRGPDASPPSTTVPLAKLLIGPFAALGSADPDADAALAAHAVVGMLSDFLWTQTRPSRAQIEHAAEFCLGAVVPR
jgi:AcrR family transcriptional regulator